MGESTPTRDTHHVAVIDEHGLARILHRAGMTLLEVARPDRRVRRLHGKSDPLGAFRAAVTALSGRGSPPRKTGLSNRYGSFSPAVPRRARREGGDEPDPCSAGDRTRTDTRHLPQSGQRELAAALAQSRQLANPPLTQGRCKCGLGKRGNDSRGVPPRPNCTIVRNLARRTQRVATRDIFGSSAMNVDGPACDKGRWCGGGRTGRP